MVYCVHGVMKQCLSQLTVRVLHNIDVSWCSDVVTSKVVTGMNAFVDVCSAVFRASSYQFAYL
jgi:hypothetical protein